MLTYLTSTSAASINELFILATRPDETDIDDIDESDIDSPFIKGGETVELQRPISTLVTDIDTVKEMKDLPPPLLPTTVCFTILYLLISLYFISKWRELYYKPLSTLSKPY